ncbi:MAG: hypothetical protein V1489_02690, partial [Candidatus Liptonbacteria bacterium]
RTVAEDYLDEIAETAELKNISAVALFAHAPCGKAYQHGMNLLMVARELVKAKECVERAIPKAEVACFMHIHRQKELLHRKAGRYTYFMSARQLASHTNLQPWAEEEEVAS